LLNLENAKGITRLETSYSFQKEKDSLQFAQQRKQALLKSEIATRKANQRTTYIGLILAFGLLIVLFVFFLEKQKSNRKLNQANEQLAFSNEEIKASHEEVQSMNSTLQETLTLVSEQKNDIIASINYAERIQRAVLPADKTIKDIFPEHFIFYQPRDIVSGDFYWVAKTEAQPIYEQSADFQEGRVLLGFSSEKHVLVAADCTGHGVPGAFMTMLCSQALDSIVIQNNVCAPGEILNLLNVYLKDALKSQQTKVNDGMDIGICVVDVTEKTLTFAGAKNALLYYQNEQLHQVKGDLYSINGYAPEGYLFTSHTIPLTPSFTFYMHSDGYPDQFGGPQGKKFLATRFRQMLQEIAPLPMQQQHEQLDARLKDWMQAESQVDDVLVVGVRLS
jgi:serine phosphatase RsbU (regulator of sigma subunit)